MLKSICPVFRFVSGIFLLALASVLNAQFLDEFDRGQIEPWFFFTGDGEVAMDFVPHDDFARIRIDAREDRHNVWWSIIKRNIAEEVDLSQLQQPGYELRVQARIRVSHAPRRVNFMINTQRTTDFHEHLAEYDIAETQTWHTLSYTTRDLDVRPGDSLFVQLGVTDWGGAQYEVDIDAYRADVVKLSEAEPDVGEPLTYHAPVPPLISFSESLSASHCALIRQDFPEVNFSNWRWNGPEGSHPLLSVNGSQWIVMRWDVSHLSSAQVDSLGVLQLRLHSHASGGGYVDTYGEDLGVEFGKLRVIEILNADPQWQSDSVTYASLTQGLPYEQVFNEQMTYDVDLAPDEQGYLRLTLSRPVMQRLLDGTTQGLLIRPLGAVSANFFSGDSDDSPKLYFNLK